VTVQIGATRSPDFLLHFETCRSCVSVSLAKHAGVDGGQRRVPGETERSSNPAAAFHQHVEEAETTPETRCGDD